MTRTILTAFAGLLSAGAGWAGQESQISLKWSELAPRITGKKVALVLPGGASVQGTVRGVEPGSLLLDISKTSNKRVQPKGLCTVPRQSVSVLRLTEYRKLGRLLVTSGVLAAAGTLTALGVSGSGLTEGTAAITLPAVGAAGTVGLGVAGYYVGKAVDKRVTDIRVAPGD